MKDVFIYFVLFSTKNGSLSHYFIYVARMPYDLFFVCQTVFFSCNIVTFEGVASKNYMLTRCNVIGFDVELTLILNNEIIDVPTPRISVLIVNAS